MLNSTKPSGPVVHTTCPYCGVGCGVMASVLPDGDVDIRGDKKHPANFGRLCSKGSALGQTVALDDRLLSPQIAGRDASWDKALDLVAGTFAETIAKHGPDSVAFYVSGQLLSEDYYVANKLMKGFIGSANIDTNSRLCMSSAVAGHKRAFGEDIVPGIYEDLELADLVVLVGSNMAWCHPILYQRIAAAKEERGTKVVVIDPRRTATSELADLHLAINPGSDVALFNALLAELVRRQLFDVAFINSFTNHFEEAVHCASSISLTECCALTGLRLGELKKFLDLFCKTERVVTAFSQGVNQSSSGTDKVNAIINCHLATARIGRPGMGPFSLTGQPNAMGGREVGGLSSMLACHMDIENKTHRDIVSEFWNAPKIASKPGLKAVDLMQAIESGAVKAVWIMATSPVDSMPDAGFVQGALQKCPFVVVSDNVTETGSAKCADVVLPSLAWGEKDGTVTNSERRISRQRAFLSAPGEARADWWQLAEVGRRMGFQDAFQYETPAEIFREFAALSGFKNYGERGFDISAYAGLDDDGYQRLKSFQWPAPAAADGEPTDPSARMFAGGRFFTADQRANFVATPFRPVAETTSPAFPLILNTGRVRDQWHTMTRTGKSPRLSGHIAEPFVEIHPGDAERLGLSDACLATVTSKNGEIVVRALITERQKPGSVFVPIHWTNRHASSARVGTLVGQHTDPLSGQPEFKASPVSVSRYDAKAYGFAVVRDRPAKIDADYWAIAPVTDGWRIELAWLCDDGIDFTAAAKDLFGPGVQDAEMPSFHDQKSALYRYAAFKDDELLGLLFVAPEPVVASRTLLIEALAESWQPDRHRHMLLAGKAAANQRDRGATVCSCFGVGYNDIADAVVSGKCTTVESIGDVLQAGTNCGSCRPELKRIIHDQQLKKAG